MKNKENINPLANRGKKIKKNLKINLKMDLGRKNLGEIKLELNEDILTQNHGREYILAHEIEKGVLELVDKSLNKYKEDNE